MEEKKDEEWAGVPAEMAASAAGASSQSGASASSMSALSLSDRCRRNIESESEYESSESTGGCDNFPELLASGRPKVHACVYDI